MTGCGSRRGEAVVVGSPVVLIPPPSPSATPWLVSPLLPHSQRAAADPIPHPVPADVEMTGADKGPEGAPKRFEVKKVRPLVCHALTSTSPPPLTRPHPSQWNAVALWAWVSLRPSASALISPRTSVDLLLY